MKKVGRPPQDAARRLERAHRILDAATELILCRGYDSTTIDQVAKTAGVAKGTIYLHWKTRDELFAALLRRERAVMLAEVRRAGPGDLEGLLRALAGSLLRRPLMRANVLGDSEVLGKLTRQKRDGGSPIELGPPFEAYLGALRKHGALRTDLSSVEHLTVLGATLYGFLLLSGVMPEEFRLQDERLADVLADTGRRAMQSDRSLTADEAGAVAQATAEFLDAAIDIAQAKLDDSLGTKEHVK